MTAQFGFYLGWAIILVIAYTVKDITDVVAGDLGQPFGSLCLQVLGPNAGLAMFSLNMIGQWYGSVCLPLSEAMADGPQVRWRRLYSDSDPCRVCIQ